MGKLRKRPFPAPEFVCRCRKLAGFILFLSVCLMILSCVSSPFRSERPRGIYHRVKSGETLSAIARAYQVNLQDLAEINNIENPDRIEADGVIFVPDANQVLDDVLTAARIRRPPPETPAAEAPAATARVETPGPETPKREVPGKEIAKKEVPPRRPAPEAGKGKEGTPVEAAPKEQAALTPAVQKGSTPPKISDRPEGGKTESRPARQDEGEKEGLQFDKKRFIWPVKGTVVSRFGIQPNRMYFNGIRISAGEGTSVQAAAGGSVIFSAPLKDYGETIIIKHEDQYATVYTHLGVRTVREETQVKKGDRIAFLGKGDGGGDPYLHFEVRYKNKARNPLFFLP